MLRIVIPAEDAHPFGFRFRDQGGQSLDPLTRSGTTLACHSFSGASRISYRSVDTLSLVAWAYR